MAFTYSYTRDDGQVISMAVATQAAAEAQAAHDSALQGGPRPMHIADADGNILVGYRSVGEFHVEGPILEIQQQAGPGGTIVDVEVTIGRQVTEVLPLEAAFDDSKVGTIVETQVQMDPAELATYVATGPEVVIAQP